jgi:hypothetical protein
MMLMKLAGDQWNSTMTISTITANKGHELCRDQPKLVKCSWLPTPQKILHLIIYTAAGPYRCNRLRKSDNLQHKEDINKGEK